MVIFRMFNRIVRPGNMMQHFDVNITDKTASRCNVSVANDILWGEFMAVGPNLCKPIACRSMQWVLSQNKNVLVSENKATLNKPPSL